MVCWCGAKRGPRSRSWARIETQADWSASTSLRHACTACSLRELRSLVLGVSFFIVETPVLR